MKSDRVSFITVVRGLRSAFLAGAATVYAIAWPAYAASTAGTDSEDHASLAAVQTQSSSEAGTETQFASIAPQSDAGMANPAAAQSASATTTKWPTNPGLADIFTLSGFGTLGVSHSTLKSADVVNSAFQPTGTGRSRRYDIANTSIFGVQLAARFTDRLSAVVQVLAQQGYDNRFVPHLEWANVKYAVTPNFSVRVGRIEIPTFANSDFRNVGYANPWLHAPNEVYDNEPITNSDGADVSYAFGIGQAVNTVRLMIGTSAFHAIPGNYRVQTKRVYGAFDTFEYGAFTGRVAYIKGTIAISAFPPPYDSLPGSSTSISVSYDPGKWFVQSEIARVTSDNITPGYLAAYITGGYRIGKFTPFLTYSRSYSMQRSTLTPNANQGQHTFSAGVRWDVAHNIDLKVQYDHIGLPANSSGNLMNLQPTYQLGTGTNVLGIALDFVF